MAEQPRSTGRSPILTLTGLGVLVAGVVVLLRRRRTTRRQVAAADSLPV